MTILTKEADYTYQIPSAPQSYAYDPSAIENYVFPAAMITKLMAEQNWTLDYATRVLREYRRFIHLAATMNHEVTPSLAVDEAWHMHLTFSRDYWEKLTPLLPAPLHHEPGEGLPTDKAKYAEQYRRTLDDYQATFGEAPPADIWRVAKPKPRARFLMVPAILGSVVTLLLVTFFAQLSQTAMIVLGAVVFLLIGSFAAAMQPYPHDPKKGGDGSSGGGSCGGASCGYTGGDSDSCDSGGGSDGGSCGDGGSSCGGGGCGGGGCGS